MADSKKKGKRPAPAGETKAQKFSRVVSPRVEKAIEAISLIGNCASSNYAYTEKQVEQIGDLIEKAMNDMLAEFNKGDGEEVKKSSIQI